MPGGLERGFVRLVERMFLRGEGQQRKSAWLVERRTAPSLLPRHTVTHVLYTLAKITSGPVRIQSMAQSLCTVYSTTSRQYTVTVLSLGCKFLHPSDDCRLHCDPCEFVKLRYPLCGVYPETHDFQVSRLHAPTLSSGKTLHPPLQPLPITRVRTTPYQ